MFTFTFLFLCLKNIIFVVYYFNVSNIEKWKTHISYTNMCNLNIYLRLPAKVYATSTSTSAKPDYEYYYRITWYESKIYLKLRVLSVDWEDPSFWDNSENVKVTTDLPDDRRIQPREQEIHYIASDQSGNSAVCTVKVSIIGLSFTCIYNCEFSVVWEWQKKRKNQNMHVIHK